MASLRDIRRRITSVKNTRKITRAMKLVAGAKLRKATEAAVAARPYQETLQRVLQRVVSAEESIEHPMLTVPQNTTDILLIIISSDRGLCGGFNSQLFKFAKKQMDDLASEGKNVRLMLYGRKCVGYFKKSGLELGFMLEGKSPDEYSDLARDLVETLTTDLNENRFEKAIICYNEFKSVMTQAPTVSQVLPMKLEVEEEETSGDYIYEPQGDQILGELLPMVLHTQILQAFLETEAGEQAARMQAMDNATRNAGELIDKLTLQYNRARQAAITSELIEIISGAEAL